MAKGNKARAKNKAKAKEKKRNTEKDAKKQGLSLPKRSKGRK